MSNIKKGDLVMVVKPCFLCCGTKKHIGRIFIAGDKYTGSSCCGTCGDEHDIDGVWVGDEYAVISYQYIIKIDPPKLPEDITTDEELTA